MSGFSENFSVYPMNHPNMHYPDARYRAINLPSLLGVISFYVLLDKIVLTFFSGNGLVSVIWPSSGFALAVLLIGGKRYYWSVFFGAFLANAMMGIALLKSAAIATGDLVEALICVSLLARNCKFDVALKSLRSYLLLVMAGSVGSISGALAGATTLLLAGSLSPQNYFLNLVHWWMGDMLGIALITPLILVWRLAKNDWRGTRRLAEAALLLGMTFGVGQIVFLGWFQASVGHLAKGYVMFLFITWVAVRLGTAGTVIALSMTAFQALLGAYRGVGFFANDIAESQLVNYWLYAMILSGVGMAIATFIGERRAAEQKLQESKNRLQATLDAVPDLLFEIGPDGRVHDYHSPRTDLLVASPEIFLGRTLSEILPPEAVETCMLALRDAHENGFSSGRQYELPLPQGKLCFELSVAKKLADSTPEPRFICLSRDITERKQTEKALRESETRLRDLMTNAPVAIFMKDVAGRYLLVNPRCGDLFHIPCAALGGKTDYDLFPQGIAEALCKNDQMVIRDGRPIEVEELVPQNDGMHTFISSRFPLRDSSGEIYAVCGIATDVTEYKDAKRQVHDLTAHLLNVREEEKIRIAHEIHDELGGTLNALKIDACWLLRKVPAHGETAALARRIKAMTQWIDRAIRFTRHLIDDMRPAVLDDLGLLAAIEWQAAEFTERTGIDCRVTCIEDEANLNEQRSVALFRILQEALTNVSRHSRASKVEIEFFHNENEVILTISDNGCGSPENIMSTSKLYGSKSYGMLGMKERVDQLGGKITFSSPSSGGLSVKVSLPLPAGERSA